MAHRLPRPAGTRGGRLPVGRCDGWQQLETGAWVSTHHEIAFLTLELGDVEGAASIDALMDEDPFEELR